MKTTDHRYCVLIYSEATQRCVRCTSGCGQISSAKVGYGTLASHEVLGTEGDFTNMDGIARKYDLYFAGPHTRQGEATELNTCT